MYSRSSRGTLPVCVLMMWAMSLIAPHPALGQAGDVDLPGYFARLGPDASLWYQHVQTLASPAFEGRAPGTRGMAWAAEYIEFYLRAYGLQPAFPERGDPSTGTAARSYRQSFTIDEALSGGHGTTATQESTGQPIVAAVNVAGILAGQGRLKDEYLVIGGHYDHMGAVLRGASPGAASPGAAIAEGASPGGNTATLLGADDNASGTAAVLILAKRLAAAYREAPDGTDRRSIIFVAFTAEERGRLGSRQFVQSPPVPLRSIQAMVNLDMVARLRDNTVSLSGFGTAVQFPEMLGGSLAHSGLHVTTEPGSGGSDQMSFLEAGIPALYAMTGGHNELHQPTDLASTMNPEGATKVIDLVERIARRLAEQPGVLTFAAQPDIGGAVCRTQFQPMAAVGGSSTAVRSTQPPPETGMGGAPSVDGQPTVLPDTPGGRCALAFLEAFNSGDDDRTRAFEKRFRAASAAGNRSIQDRVDQLNQIRADLGRLTLVRLDNAGPTDIAIRAIASNTGEEWTLGFQLEDEPPNGVLAIRITPSAMPDPAEKYMKPIDEPLRKDAVKQIGDVLREVYVYPEIGERMAAALARHESEGRYSAVTSADGLARRWTADLVAVCNDYHLSVVPYMGGMRPSTCGARGSAEEDARNSYGFQKPELLPGNIGYVKFDMFDGREEAQEAAAAALDSVANCAALIFDLRENVGGSPKMIQFIASYLFDKPTHLDSFLDRLGQPAGETWTLDTVPGKRFPSSLPVYVLTSSTTFSAAEAFAYDLQHLGRATVAGARTTGGAHKVTDRIVNDRFLIHVPYLRAYNPITKGNWQGVGVEPDIRVPASEALDAARRNAASKLGTRR